MLELATVNEERKLFKLLNCYNLYVKPLRLSLPTDEEDFVECLTKKKRF